MQEQPPPVPDEQKEREKSLPLPIPENSRITNNFQLAGKDETITFDIEKSSSSAPGIFGQSSHPITALVHVCYKIFLVFLYLTLPLTTSTLNFMAIMILATAVDFWLVKNVVGRKLVGLRWWVQFSEDGEEQWRFQSRVDERCISSASQTIFWWTLYIFILIWGILTIINTIGMKIQHIFLCVFSLVLLKYNLNCYGYCYKTKGENMSRFINQHGNDMVIRYMRGSIVTNMQ